MGIMLKFIAQQFAVCYIVCIITGYVFVIMLQM